MRSPPLSARSARNEDGRQPEKYGNTHHVPVLRQLLRALEQGGPVFLGADEPVAIGVDLSEHLIDHVRVCRCFFPAEFAVAVRVGGIPFGLPCSLVKICWRFAPGEGRNSEADDEQAGNRNSRGNSSEGGG